MPNPVAIADGPLPPWLDRALALAVLVAGVGVTLALARIDPDVRGLGTHEALGLEPCGWPERFGRPCPTCGVTTAACHLVHLSLWRALATQPFGAALAVLGWWLMALAATDLARGRAYAARCYEVRLGWWVLGGVALAALSWAYRWFTWPA